MTVGRTLLSGLRSKQLARRPVWLTALVVVSLTAVGSAQRASLAGAATSRSRTEAPSRSLQPLHSARRASGAPLPSAAKAQISAAIGEDQPQYHVVADRGAARMANPAGTVTAEFRSDGVTFHRGADRWGMSLQAYGYGDTLRAAGAAAPSGTRNRVEYRRGPLTEWYINGPLGLEQGFTLERAPGDSNGEPLTLAFALSGNLTPSVDPGKRSLTLHKDGGAALRYGGLTALDANGRELQAWLELVGKELHLRVDDAGARYPVTIDPYVQAATLTTRIPCDPSGVCDDGAPGDFFGYSVSISADASTVAVGALYKYTNSVLTGAVYVFVKPSDFEGGWNSVFPIRFKTKLLASDGAVNGPRLGSSVAVSSDGAAIVAGAADIYAPIPGAAYVFVRPANGWDTAAVQTEAAKLTAAPAGNVQDWGSFGTSVAISGDGGTIAVGAPDRRVDTVPHGAAYVFHRPATGWANATESQILTGNAQSYLGSSVSLSEDATTLIVGAPGGADPWGDPADPLGTAYVLTRPENSGAYATVARLRSSEGNTHEPFGVSLGTDADGSTVVVGALAGPYADATGAALVFVRPTAGWGSTGIVLTEAATLTDSDGNRTLGISVGISLDGNTIVAGIRDGFGPGAAYFFARPIGGWATATEDRKVIASDGLGENWFGNATSLSADGAVAVVGAPRTTIDASEDQGAAYVFTGSATTPRASVSPSSVTFDPQPIGTTSAARTVTVTNTGSGPLHVTNVGANGPFTSTQNCVAASPIAPGESCFESVAFSPVSIGSATGTLSFTDDSGGTSGTVQQVALEGEGQIASTTTTIVSASPNPVFPGQAVNVTVSVVASGGLAVPSGNVTVQASTGENCTTHVQSNGCALSFSTTGDRTLTASYDGNGEYGPSTSSPLTVKVVDLKLSASPASQVYGRKTSYRLTVAGVNGFTGTVSLACSGGPVNTTCAVSPTSVTVSGSTAKAKVAVTVPAGAASGTYTLTFTGTSGGVTRSTTASLVVK